jgi:hypothetical protein
LAYIDDIIVKRIKRYDHIRDLAETFTNLRAANLKLNLEKCVYGIQKGKVLGCLVSTKGIEANPDKIKAIMDMQEPTSVKEIQKLIGRVAALNRFIPRKKPSILQISPKLQKHSMERSSESGIRRAQGILDKYDKTLPNRA